MRWEWKICVLGHPQTPTFMRQGKAVLLLWQYLARQSQATFTKTHSSYSSPPSVGPNCVWSSYSPVNSNSALVLNSKSSVVFEFWEVNDSLSLWKCDMPFIYPFFRVNPNQTKLFSQSKYQGGLQTALWTFFYFYNSIFESNDPIMV